MLRRSTRVICEAPCTPPGNQANICWWRRADDERRYSSPPHRLSYIAIANPPRHSLNGGVERRGADTLIDQDSSWWWRYRMISMCEDAHVWRLPCVTSERELVLDVGICHTITVTSSRPSTRETRSRLLFRLARWCVAALLSSRTNPPATVHQPHGSDVEGGQNVYLYESSRMSDLDGREA